ncbi:hypothetical protein [Streptomyces sp. NPDC056401]|uniref:hypothetical protein n=1 Tax=Streptomyces sp. NPDC056401 TaxID=3345809 RepID=UPI0035D847F4
MTRKNRLSYGELEALLSAADDDLTRAATERISFTNLLEALLAAEEDPAEAANSTALPALTLVTLRQQAADAATEIFSAVITDLFPHTLKDTGEYGLWGPSGAPSPEEKREIFARMAAKTSERVKESVQRIDRALINAEKMQSAVPETPAAAELETPLSLLLRDLTRSRKALLRISGAFMDADAQRTQGVVRGLLSRSADHVVDIQGVLATLKADAQGVDMSFLEVSALDELIGVIWDLQTSWPDAWFEEIRRHSVNVRPGVFEIRRGLAPQGNALVSA